MKTIKEIADTGLEVLGIGLICAAFSGFLGLAVALTTDMNILPPFQLVSTLLLLGVAIFGVHSFVRIVEIVEDSNPSPTEE